MGQSRNCQLKIEWLRFSFSVNPFLYVFSFKNALYGFFRQETAEEISAENVDNFFPRRRTEKIPLPVRSGAKTGFGKGFPLPLAKSRQDCLFITMQIRLPRNSGRFAVPLFRVPHSLYSFFGYNVSAKRAVSKPYSLTTMLFSDL